MGPFEHPRPAAGLGHDQGQAAAIAVVAGREGVQGLFVQKLDLHLIFQCSRAVERVVMPLCGHVNRKGRSKSNALSTVRHRLVPSANAKNKKTPIFIGVLSS
jgi:hypothetical protein